MVIISHNIQGGINEKIRKFVGIMDEENARVGLIQESWSKKVDEYKLKKAVGNKVIIFNHGKRGETHKGKGTITVIDNEWVDEIINVETFMEGYIQGITLNSREKTVWQIVNAYFPYEMQEGEKEEEFLEKTITKIEEWRRATATEKTRFLIMGDFNRVLNGRLDRTTGEVRKEDKIFGEKVGRAGWIDVYRMCNNQERKYTRKRGSTETEARIDLAMTRDNGWTGAKIKDTGKYKSAHRYLTVKTEMNKFKKSKMPELKRWNLKKEKKTEEFVEALKKINEEDPMKLIGKIKEAANSTLPVYREKRISDITVNEETREIEGKIEEILEEMTEGRTGREKELEERREELRKKRNELFREYGERKRERIKNDQTTKALFQQCRWENPVSLIWHLKGGTEEQGLELKERVKRGFEKFFKKKEGGGEGEMEIPERNAATIRNISVLREVRKDEIEKIIRDSKDNTPGNDKISNGMWKIAPNNIVEILTKIVNKIIRTAQWPVELKIIQILPIPKISNALTAANYRPIGLLPTMLKIVTTTIDRQVRSHCRKYKIISPQQQAYQRGCNTTNHGRLTKNLMEDARRNNRTLWILNIDKENAYGTMDHQKALEVLRKLGFDEHFVNVIKNFYENFKAEVITGKGVTEKFAVEAGAVQGDPLSCILFILTNSEPTIRKLEEKGEGYKSPTLPNTPVITVLGFCDDEQLFNDKIKKMARVLESDYIPTVKWSKTKMRPDKFQLTLIGRARIFEKLRKTEIIIEGTKVKVNEPNNNIKALGFPISSTGNCPNMVKVLGGEVTENIERLARIPATHKQFKIMVYAKNQAKILSKSQVNPFKLKWLKEMEAKE